MTRRNRDKHPNGDAATYATLLDDPLNGRIRATALHEVTAPGDSIGVQMRSENAQGQLETVTVQHAQRRLVTLQFEEPDAPAAPRAVRGNR
jgi:hypothetical protein